MKHPKAPLVATCATLLAAATLMAGNVLAADEEQPSPLQFYTGSNGSYAKATIEAGLGFFWPGRLMVRQFSQPRKHVRPRKV